MSGWIEDEIREVEWTIVVDGTSYSLLINEAPTPQVSAGTSVTRGQPKLEPSHVTSLLNHRLQQSSTYNYRNPTPFSIDRQRR